MDPRQLFTDDRLRNVCVYCGAKPDTSDHVPARVLLDEPYPADLQVVDACRDCNGRFSLDEQYVSCFLECVVSGTSEPSLLKREKIRTILTSDPKLRETIRKSGTHDGSGALIWKPERERVMNVALKLARGHAAYEMSEPHFEEPDEFLCAPLVSMSPAEVCRFLSPSDVESELMPEIGSRRFIRALTEGINIGWQVVQPGRYRYLVETQRDGLAVQALLSEYLACRFVWS